MGSDIHTMKYMQDSNTTKKNHIKNMAGAAGFEPTIPGPKPGALPLGHAPKCNNYNLNKGIGLNY